MRLGEWPGALGDGAGPNFTIGLGPQRRATPLCTTLLPVPATNQSLASGPGKASPTKPLG